MSENIIQEWEGVVYDVSPGRGTFTARLTAVRGEMGDHVAEIYIAAVPDGDMSLIVPGAIFRWRITDDGGQIRFPQLNEWTDKDIEIAVSRGKELCDYFYPVMDMGL